MPKGFRADGTPSGGGAKYGAMGGRPKAGTVQKIVRLTPSTIQLIKELVAKGEFGSESACVETLFLAGAKRHKTKRKPDAP